MPTFNNSDNIPQFVPEGDYTFCVTGFDAGLSTGPKTKGSDMFSLAIEIEGKGNTVFENLIDHQATRWKLDTFLRSAGVALKLGERFEFEQELANANGCRFVNPIGLRGWCRLQIEEYTPKGATKPVNKNKVACFYTDRPKLPPRAAANPTVQEDDYEILPF